MNMGYKYSYNGKVGEKTMKTVAFSKVQRKDGFWKDRYALNLGISIYAVKKVFQYFAFANREDSDMCVWVNVL